MNSLEQKDVKNPGAICDGLLHNHSSVYFGDATI